MKPKWYRPDQIRKIAYHKTQQSRTNLDIPGILFLGGLASDMDGNKALYIESWAQKFGCAFVRFDYTGHGKSNGDFASGSIDSWFLDALSVLDM